MKQNYKLTNETAYPYFNYFLYLKCKKNYYSLKNISILSIFFEFSDSYFDEDNSIIWFQKLDLNTDFTILLQNITMTNISFPINGRIFNFQQQLSNSIEIKNLTISDSVNSQINIEASNIQLLSLPTKVSISSMNINNIDWGFSSFIMLNGNGILNITDSTIQYIHSYDNGAILRAIASNAIASVYNSALQYNSAINGGLFFVENEGFISAVNWSISDNFAVVSGIVNAHNNGYFELNNWRITSNSAIANQISQIFGVVFTPNIIGCTINSNSAITKENVLSYMASSINWGDICFFKDKFKEYLQNNTSILDQTYSQYMIQTISASVLIDGGCVIESQEAVVDSFVSNVTIQNSKIQNCNIAGVSIQITASSLTYMNIYSQNISSKNPDLPMIQVSLDSNMNLNNVTYDTWSVPLFNILSSSTTIALLTLNNTKVTNYLIKFEQTTNATINGLNVISTSSSLGNIVFTGAYIDSISNSYFTSWSYYWAILHWCAKKAPVQNKRHLLQKMSPVATTTKKSPLKKIAYII